MLAALAALLLTGPASPPKAPTIQGDYVESRTADVYTGPCFSNGEVFISGDKAVLAWKVTKGSWGGVDLSGLCVAAAVRGTTTFSEDDPGQARSVVIVDKQADPAQRKALVAMATHLAGDRLSKVVAVRVSLIDITVEAHEAGVDADKPASKKVHHAPHAPRASFWAPGLASILTRPMDDADHTCGNEVVAYAPLSAGVDALPAYTMKHEFRGEGLETRWDDRNCRGSFVGHFAY